jgi:hypothetical protein
MLFVYDKSRDASEFVVLDARRFEDEPVATVRLPCRVPVGFHGAWIADTGAATLALRAQTACAGGCVDLLTNPKNCGS